MDYSPKHLARQPLIEIVEEYTRLFGWTLFPIRNKNPLVKWTPLQSEKPSLWALRQMFSHPWTNGIAVVMGEASNGLVIRDFDSEESYQNWKQSHRKLAKALPTTKTWKGYHVLFRGPSLFQKFPGRGGEYRGTTGQYCVLPPSKHPDTDEPYRWVVYPEDDTIPVLDDPWSAGLILGERVTGEQKDYTHDSTSKNSNSTTVQGTSGRRGKQGTGTPPITKYCHGYSPISPPNGDNPQKKRTVPGICQLLPGRRIAGREKGYWWPEEFQGVVQRHRARKEGERNHKLFLFVRDLQGLGVKWDECNVRVAFSLWWRRSRKKVKTKDRAVSWEDYRRAWDGCTFPKGKLDLAYLRETSAGIELAPGAERLPVSAQVVLRACVILQELNGEEAFYLSYENAGGLIDLCKAVSERAPPETNLKPLGQFALQELMRRGWIERLTLGSKAEGKASTYRLLRRERARPV